MDDRFHPVHGQFGKGPLEEFSDHSATDTSVPVVLFTNQNANFTFFVLEVHVFDGAVANELVINQNTKQPVCLGREVFTVPFSDFSKRCIPASYVSVHLTITPPFGNGRKFLLWKCSNGYVHDVFLSISGT